MTLRDRIRKSLSGSQRVPYAAVALWVGVGLVVIMSAAWAGRWLALSLGILVLAGASVAAFTVREVSRLVACAQDLAKRLEELRHRLEQIEQVVNQAGTTAPSVREIDLAAFGKGEPSELAACRLDRDAFPRLVSIMDAEPPPEPAEVPSPTASTPAAAGDTRPEWADQPSADLEASGLTTRNLLRAWRIGLRNGDLASCRSVYAALVDTADAVTLEPLRVTLADLADQTETSLREAFAAHRSRGDCAGMLSVGERICELIPDRPVAGEFRRIEPRLRRLLASRARATTPSLRVLP